MINFSTPSPEFSRSSASIDAKGSYTWNFSLRNSLNWRIAWIICATVNACACRVNETKNDLIYLTMWSALFFRRWFKNTWKSNGLCDCWCWVDDEDSAAGVPVSWTSSGGRVVSIARRSLSSGDCSPFSATGSSVFEASTPPSLVSGITYGFSSTRTVSLCSEAASSVLSLGLTWNCFIFSSSRSASLSSSPNSREDLWSTSYLPRILRRSCLSLESVTLTGVGSTPLKLVVVLTAAILGEVSDDSFAKMFCIKGKLGSFREVEPGGLTEDLAGELDVAVNVVLVLVVDVVGVAFDKLKAKWLLNDIMD